MNRQISEKLDEHETNIISKLERGKKVYKIIYLIKQGFCIMQEGEMIQAYVYARISAYLSEKSF